MPPQEHGDSQPRVFKIPLLSRSVRKDPPNTLGADFLLRFEQEQRSGGVSPRIGKMGADGFTNNSMGEGL